MLRYIGFFLSVIMMIQSVFAASLDYDCVKKIIQDETAAMDLLTTGMNSNSRILDVLSGSLGRFGNEIRRNSSGGDTCIDSVTSGNTLTELSTIVSRVRRDNSSFYFGLLSSSENLKIALKSCLNK